MPWTNFPFGISVTTQTGTVSGMINATSLTLNSNTGTAAGTITAGTVSASQGIFTSLSINSGTQAVGQLYFIPLAFGTSSALQQFAVTPGLANCSLDAVYLTFSTVSALVANYTVQVGSAGSVVVATVANTTASVGVVQSLAVTAATFDGTSSAIVAIRSVQGTAGDSSLTLVVRRTA